MLHLHFVVKGPHTSILFEYIGEGDGHLLLFHTIAILAQSLRNRYLSAFGELWHGGCLLPALKGKRRCERDGQRHHPRVSHGLVVDKLASVKDDSTIIHLHHHTLTAATSDVGHLRRWLGTPVILMGILACRHRIEVAQRRSAH